MKDRTCLAPPPSQLPAHPCLRLDPQPGLQAACPPLHLPVAGSPGPSLTGCPPRSTRTRDLLASDRGLGKLYRKGPDGRHLGFDSYTVSPLLCLFAIELHKLKHVKTTVSWQATQKLWADAAWPSSRRGEPGPSPRLCPETSRQTRSAQSRGPSLSPSRAKGTQAPHSKHV